MAVNKSSTAETVYQISNDRKLTHSEIQKNKFKNAMMPEITNSPSIQEKIEEERASSDNIRQDLSIYETAEKKDTLSEKTSLTERVKDPRKTGRPKMYTEELDRIVVKTNKSTKEKAFAMAAQQHKSMAQYVAELIDRDFDMNYRG